MISNSDQGDSRCGTEREEMGTLHSVPMITNEDHDYGSRNFNIRDNNSINPVSTSKIKF